LFRDADEGAAATDDAEEELVAADDAEEAALDELLAPPAEGTPGDDTILFSCAPAVIGPEGFAGQLPGGFTGELCPNGMVPGAPTARPPTNLVKLAPWNWHWKSPLSSAFFGACWQYGTLRESGVLRGCCAKI
jgi:hypothetical protein